MARNLSTSAQLLVALVVLLVFVNGILAGTPSTCANSPKQQSCPPIPGQNN
ncbi:unnamed protein product [Urochloa decumbens]|uniref:Uncharacterized protein n=1 Tax=Urochloa decumbens TaxID=240449 RepID=A0ABC9B4J6_9POAL